MKQEDARVDKAQRRKLVIELYQGGATYETIGRAVGVTRERVRQLIVIYGVQLNPRSERVYRTAFPARAREVEALFLELQDDEAVAKATGIELAAVRRFVDEAIPDPDVLRRRRKAQAERFSDAELLACLNAAAEELPSPMAHADYADWSRNRMLDDKRRWPGPQAAMLRFGSWRKALVRAGLPANASAGLDPRFDLDDAVAAMVLAWRTTGRPPTVEGYDAWRDGRSEYPSVATVRKLVGGWDELQLAAWPLVHDRPFPNAGGDEVGSSGDAPAGDDLQETGSPYRRADVSPALRLLDPFERDPQELERSLRAHSVLQNSLADRARSEGYEPLSPTLLDPEFDLAWRLPTGMLVIVEVKSTTASNLEGQLRLGLGQLLRYGQTLQGRGEPIRHILAVELMPADETWLHLFARLRVRFVTSATLDVAFAA